MDFKPAEAQLAKLLRQHERGIITLSELTNKVYEVIAREYPQGYEPRGIPSFILGALPPLRRIPRIQRGIMINLNLKFTKTGREIKVAAANLSRQLGERLNRRNMNGPRD